MIWTDSESSETAILLIGTSEVVVEVSSTLVVEGLVVVDLVVGLWIQPARR